MGFADALVFGGGNNTVTTPSFQVGGQKLTSQATVTIAPGGTLTLAGTMALAIADQSGVAGTGTFSTCVFDMSGGTIHLHRNSSTVVVGRYAGKRGQRRRIGHA